MSNRLRNAAALMLLPALLLTACRERKSQTDTPEAEVKAAVPLDAAEETAEAHPAKSRTALYLDSLGFVDVAGQDSTIAVSLLYATPRNFTGQVLYDDLREAYLHPDAAAALVRAQRLLKEARPLYTLIVYDAARPMSVQRTMWDMVKGTSKSIYVSNPSRGGGLHNYGLAVDVNILDSLRRPLPMGTEVDHLGIEAHITDEARFVETGVITPQERENRLLLRQVMRRAGFRPLPSEWWHFNLHSRETARQHYTVIE